MIRWYQSSRGQEIFAMVIRFGGIPPAGPSPAMTAGDGGWRRATAFKRACSSPSRQQWHRSGTIYSHHSLSWAPRVSDRPSTPANCNVHDALSLNQAINQQHVITRTKSTYDIINKYPVHCLIRELIDPAADGFSRSRAHRPVYK